MKKIIAFFAITLSLSMLSNNANAQSFEKGDFLVNLGTGLGYFSAQSNDNDSLSGALPALINVSFEYAFSSFGVVGRVERGGYLTNDADSTRVVGYDFLLGPSFHFLNKDRANLYTNVLFGYSNLGWTSTRPIDEAKNVKATANGFTWQLNLGGNVYFSDHIGFFFELGYSQRLYSKISGHEDGRQIWDVNTSSVILEEDWVWKRDFPNENENVNISLKGVSLRIGLALKF